MVEIWKAVKQYEGFYEVSSYGNVRSIIGWNGHSYINRVKMLSKTISTTGYEKVELFKYGSKKSFKVHRLVAIAFLPEIKGKEMVNHIDGNKKNNNLCNLEWCTQSENMIHAYNHGLVSKRHIIKKEKSTRNKYNIDLDIMLCLLKDGFKNREIAKKLKCSNGIVATRKYNFKKNGDL